MRDPDHHLIIVLILLTAIGALSVSLLVLTLLDLTGASL